jgi:hypothetical protein
VRDDRPFAGPDPPAAIFHYSRNRNGERPNRHLAGYTGILQADAYAGFGDLYDGKRKLGPITEAARWSHGRRKFFVIADTSAKGVGAPVALEAVRRIDAIFAIERDGRVRSFHVPNVTAQTLKPIIVAHVDKASYLMTDESPVYWSIGREFAGHGALNHSAEEYVRAYFWHTNTVEGFFSIFKRGVYGCYFHVSETHLHRYASEFDFRYNNRIALGINDQERTDRAIKGAAGKRLTYQTTRSPKEPPF